jgi:dTDP-4-dehydrorhamnose reductase
MGNQKKIKSVLILGSTGMLGWTVLDTFCNYENFKVFATFRDKKSIKLLQKKIGKKKIKKVKFLRFDVLRSSDTQLKKITRNISSIVNCIGIIKPHIDEINKRSENALMVNSVFPHKLSKISSSKNIKIYQIATDCVYSGKKGNYTEESIHDVTDIYGRTKSLGEVKFKNFYNLRCSIIGPEIKEFSSLFEWFKSQKINATINGFTNHLWNGLTTKVYAELLVGIIKNNIILPNSIHIVPKDQITKYNLLIQFSKILRMNHINLVKTNSKYKINRTLNTIIKNKNLEIWQASKFKKILTMEEILKFF